MKYRELQSDIRSVLPPVQPHIRLHTSDFHEKLGKLNNYSNKSGVYFYQFKTGNTQALEFLPEGCVNLLFHCDGKPQESKIIGIQTQKTVLELEKGSTYFGAKLYSTFGMKQKSVSVRDLVDHQGKISDFFGDERLAEKLGACMDFQSRIQFFESYYRSNWLDDRYTPGLEEQCSLLLCMLNGNVSINDMGEYTGYTKRYIQKRFIQHYGISPKLYGMLKRYQKTLSMLMEKRLTSSYIAMENGYYDQAHFIKDFKRFTDISPESYLHHLDMPDPLQRS